ncbi:hypothetical protein GCM10022408_37430 [Hymenobacter fastidiosus]|uniref:Uncharacterized protein n=2 Tax=Hymenobacter fastidiosus TaxID=486264 RepID=A0ABP7T1Y1_9BACT
MQGQPPLVTLQGDRVAVSRGPMAALVAIKELGTNGGGFVLLLQAATTHMPPRWGLVNRGLRKSC